MTPRHLWLKARVKECIAELAKLEEVQEWGKFTAAAKILSEELLYSITEWNKCYDK